MVLDQALAHTLLMIPLNRKWTAQDDMVVQKILETTNIEELIKKNTAFSSYADLTQAMTTGYRLSLRTDRTGPRALGLALEKLGRQVRWL